MFYNLMIHKSIHLFSSSFPIWFGLHRQAFSFYQSSTPPSFIHDTMSDHADTTKICTHCDRAIPSSNIDLHYAHCSRNLEKCKICDDMVPRKHSEEHYLSTHAPVTCSLCSETMDPEILAVHKGENCPKRIVTCDYCEFPLPAVDLFEHQEVCGNRTELCHICNRYIRLRERVAHEGTCDGVPAEIPRAIRETERERARRPPPPPPQDLSTRRLLFTIAITGIAILLGSLLFQRKPDISQVN